MGAFRLGAWSRKLFFPWVWCARKVWASGAGRGPSAARCPPCRLQVVRGRGTVGSEPGTTLDIRLLGPLSVTGGGKPVPIGGPRQRTIFVMLVLAMGAVVPVDALVEEVWEGKPPTTARTQVAICVARLRKIFRGAGMPGDVIITEHPGYRFLAEGHRVDAMEFTSLVERAERTARAHDIGAAVELLERGLALWQGGAAAGVGGRTVEDEAAQLEERRLVAYENCAAFRLRLGHHQAVPGELAALVRDHPLREGLRLQLMLAQHRAGQRAEALETFREGRRQLVAELGLEPGPALQELHHAILRGAKSPAPQPPAATAVPGAGDDAGGAPRARPHTRPAQLPRDVAAFTGREAETAALGPLRRRPSTAGGPSVGFITGPAGVGKTCVAVHWAHSVAADFPDGVLFADLTGYDGRQGGQPGEQPSGRQDDQSSGRQDGQTGGGQSSGPQGEQVRGGPQGEQSGGRPGPLRPEDVLGQFLRALGVPGQEIPVDVQERASLYRSLLAGRRVLVVLDNVSSFAQVRPLLPGSGRSATLVTSRESLGELMADHGVVTVPVSLLDRAEAVRLLDRLVGDGRVRADAAAGAELADLCDRLPLALCIAAARLASKPHWTVRRLVELLANERRRLDELSYGELEVRTGFQLSYRYLERDAAQMYRRLGLLDLPDFTSWVGAALLDIGVPHAERLIERLVDVQLLEVVGTDATGALRYRFQSLLRLYARERACSGEPPAAQRAALERVFRTWLTLAEEAHRREYGGDYAILHATAPRRPPGSGVLDALLRSPLDWFETERRSLTAAIEQAGRLGMDEIAWGLVSCASVLFETRNYLCDWRTSAYSALTAARRAGNRRGEAVMLYELGSTELFQQRYQEAVSYFSEALAAFVRTGERHGRALVLRNLAIIDRVRGDLDAAGERLTDALATFRAMGDDSARSHALRNLAQIDLELGRPGAAQRRAREAVRVAEAIGETRALAQALNTLAGAYRSQGRLDESELCSREVLRIVREKHDALGEAHALLGIGESRLAAGAFDEARAVLDEAAAVASRTQNPFVLARIHLAQGCVRAESHDVADARRHYGRAGALFQGLGSSLWTRRAAEGLAALESSPEAGAPLAVADGGSA
ncbi:BTAD domain-containing putative transcriptional regulator [Streptomyces sp. NPDC050617]|uniref:AfsR/SARP family transcriptional regulator n=1 Tax=Streptomyces sp. NPDC050617 TaxID=3154628 RepID=UPI00341B9586